VRVALMFALGEITPDDPAVELLRDSAPLEDADGNPIWPEPTPEEPRKRGR